MISRKRKSERAVKDALVTFGGATLSGVQVLISRDLADVLPVSIRVQCPRQMPLEGIEEYVTRVMVEGGITVSQTVDDVTISNIEELEALAETFIEMDRDEIITALNVAGEQYNIQFTDFQPGESQDGIDTELRRYISRYSFSAYVRDITPDEPDEPDEPLEE